MGGDGEMYVRLKHINITYTVSGLVRISKRNNSDVFGILTFGCYFPRP